MNCDVWNSYPWSMFLVCWTSQWAYSTLFLNTCLQDSWYRCLTSLNTKTPVFTDYWTQTVSYVVMSSKRCETSWTLLVFNLVLHIRKVSVLCYLRRLVRSNRTGWYLPLKDKQPQHTHIAWSTVCKAVALGYGPHNVSLKALLFSLCSAHCTK